MLLALVVALGSGVLSFLAPCTIPLLPAYVGVLSGSAVGVPHDQQGTRLLRGALLYVVGFAAVFVSLGALAGTVGTVVRDRGGPIQRGGGALVLLLGVALLLESRLGLLSRVSSGAGAATARIARSSSWLAPLLLGLVFGTAFTPCVGPFLGAVLALAAGQGGALTGSLLLGAYALGLGLPFVVAALLVASSPGLTRRLSAASRWVSLAGGALLVVLGLALLSGEYAVLAGRLAQVVPTSV